LCDITPSDSDSYLSSPTHTDILTGLSMGMAIYNIASYVVISGLVNIIVASSLENNPF